MSRTQGRLRQQLLLPLLLFETVSLLVISLAAFFVYQGQLRATLALQREVAVNVAEDIEDYLGNLQNSMLEAGLNENLARLTPEQQTQALSRLHARQTSYAALVIVGEQGQEQTRQAFRPDAPALPSNWEQHEAFSYIASGETYNGPVEFHGGLPYMSMAVPIRDPQLQIVGMLVAQVDLSPLWNVVATAGSGKTGYVYTVDQAGNLIAARDVAMVMSQFDVTELRGVQAALEGEQPTVAYQGLAGTSVIGGMSRIRNIDWNVIAELPTSEAYAYLRSLLLLLGFQILLGIILAIGVWFYINKRVVGPILEITRGAQRIGDGDLNQRVEVRTGGELTDLARVLNSTTAQLQNLIGSLEQRVAARTADLKRRSVQLEAAAQVARAAAAIRDLGQLLGEAVRLISNRFGFYHAGIFLLDEMGEYAVLRAASSEGGQKMLDRGHKLQIGEVGIVGNVAAANQPRIALDVGKDAVFFDNPDLPLTRSEMALPLAARNRVIGVLDVQSTEPGAFSDEDVAILQTLADQLALAIENARLLEESQSTLRELETLYGQRAREAWQGRAARQPATYLYDRVSVEPVSSLAPEVEDLLSPDRSAIVQDEDVRQLVSPIRLRGQSLGSIALRQDSKEEPWSAEELALVDEISTQIGLALENARLFEETQQRAERLSVVNRVSSAANTALTQDELLESVYEQISPTFQSDSCFIALYDQEAKVMEFRFHIDEGIRQPVEQYPLSGISAGVITEKKPVFIRDLENEPEYLSKIQPTGTGRLPSSWMGVPLQVGDRVIGILNMQAYHPNAWEEEDELLFSTIADQLAVALENVRLFEETQQRAERLSIVNRVSNAASTALSQDELLESVYEQISPAFQPDSSFIALYDPAAEEMDFRFHVDEGIRQPPEKQPLTGISAGVIKEKKPLFIRDLENESEHLSKIQLTGTGRLPSSWMGAPLLVGDRVIGILNMQSYQPNAWEEEDELLFSTIADQLAVALENVRLFEEARIRADELAALNEMGQALTARLSVEDVLEETYRGASRLVDITNFSIGLYDPEKEELKIALQATESDIDREMVSVPISRSVSGRVIRDRQSVLIKDNLPERLKEMGVEMVGELARSWLGVPMITGDQVLGTLTIQSFTTPRAYDEHDRDLLMAIASQTAIALQNARLFEEAQTRTEELAVLNELAQSLTATTSVEEVLKEAYQGASRLLRTKNFYVGLYDPDKFRIDFPFDVSESKRDQAITSIPADQGLTGYVVQNRTAVLIEDNMDQWLEERGIDSIGGDSLSWLGVPMMVGDEVMGVMVVQSYDAPKAYDERDQDLLTAVASQTAVAIQSAQLFEEAQKRAERDRQLYEVTAKLRRSPDITTILQTAVDELGRTLQTDRALVRLAIKPKEERENTA